jgi:hypothetical protein
MAYVNPKRIHIRWAWVPAAVVVIALSWHRRGAVVTILFAPTYELDVAEGRRTVPAVGVIEEAAAHHGRPAFSISSRR